MLDIPLIDTRQSRDLTGVLIADIVLQLLSYVAQTEREFIRQQQAERIAAAKANGIRFVRRAMERTKEFYALKSMWERGEVTGRETARRLQISRTTFCNW